MGGRRAQHVAEGHAGQHDVAHIAAAAPEQARILEPGHALADREFTHGIPQVLSSAEKTPLVRQARRGCQFVGTILASLARFTVAAISSWENRSNCASPIACASAPYFGSPCLIHRK